MEAWIQETLAQYAFQPWLVYGTICSFMLASAFGLPIPEEVVLLSAGLVGYAALHPATVIPPGASVVNVYTLATVSFVAVLVADFLIFSIGRRFGPRALRNRFFSRLLDEEKLVRTETWMKRYGYWTVILFRFTPGVRFPGHLMCGALGLSRGKFIAVDMFAAGISVPTQVLLVAFYGDQIIKYLQKFKIAIFVALALAVIGLIAHKLLARRQKA